MNSNHNQNGNNSAKRASSQWREAEAYEYEKSCPLPTCPPINYCDQEVKDLWVLFSSAQAIQQTSCTISKLAWALFGLGTLLLLGSLIMAWTYPRLTNTTTTKEVTTTKEITNTTKATTVTDSDDRYINIDYHYPKALW